MKAPRLPALALCVALFSLLTVFTFAQAGDDARWAELQNIFAVGEPLRGPDWKRAAELAWTLYEAHPGDPRRWDAWAPLLRSMPRFPEGSDDRRTWAGRVAALEAAGSRAADVPAALRELWASQKVSALVLPFTNGRLPADWLARLVPPIEALAAEFPDAGGAFVYYARLVSAVEAQDFAALPALVERMSASASPRVREFAAKRRLVLENLAQPLDLKFTALDGRAVDTARWRGRVVLVDFWATWCVPCVQAMPYLKDIYAKYHDKGLEIVNISLDRAEARPVLEKLVAQLELPWPQFFDGKAHATEYAVRYGVQPIPHVLLAGPDGMIVAVNPSKDKLESEIRRLLKL